MWQKMTVPQHTINTDYGCMWLVVAGGLTHMIHLNCIIPNMNGSEPMNVCQWVGEDTEMRRQVDLNFSNTQSYNVRIISSKNTEISHIPPDPPTSQ